MEKIPTYNTLYPDKKLNKTISTDHEFIRIWEHLDMIVKGIARLSDNADILRKQVIHNERRLMLIDERLGRYSTFLGGLDPFEKAACRED